jgi:3'(2'), 5'-bisphosphate nucleotidase
MTQRDALARLRGAQGLEDLTDVVSRAAAAILAIDRSKMEWRAKPDRSPVSAADEAANAIIVQDLAHLLPGVPIVSEEQEARPSALEAGFVLVDPLDGTREFLAGREEFTVNVAIISQGRPAVGIIAAPALGLVWRGVVGQGAERLHLAAGAAPCRASGRSAIHTRRRPAAGFDAMVSRSHFDEETDAFLQRLPLVARTPCGSSLKLARIAEGSADLYARLARTCEWDVAAGHAILAAAGGIVTAPDGTELVYGHAPDFHVPGFIAWGDPSAQTTALEHGSCRSCSTAQAG